MEHVVPSHETLSDFPVEEAKVDVLPIDVGPVQHLWSCLSWMESFCFSSALGNEFTIITPEK